MLNRHLSSAESVSRSSTYDTMNMCAIEQSNLLLTSELLKTFVRFFALSPKLVLFSFVLVALVVSFPCLDIPHIGEHVHESRCQRTLIRYG